MTDQTEVNYNISEKVDPSIEKQKLDGIWGWLLFMIVTIFLYCSLPWVYIMVSSPILDNLIHWENVSLVIAALLTVINSLTSIVVVILLLLKKRGAVFITKLFLILFPITNNVWGFVFASGSKYPIMKYISLLLQLYFCFVWFQYLLKSQRVRNTYLL